MRVDRVTYPSVWCFSWAGAPPLYGATGFFLYTSPFSAAAATAARGNPRLGLLHGAPALIRHGHGAQPGRDTLGRSLGGAPQRVVEGARRLGARAPQHRGATRH